MRIRKHTITIGTKNTYIRIYHHNPGFFIRIEFIHKYAYWKILEI